jgi:3'-phosphoadenosine 5'-phosphosulfate sulfotransferase (PAPS reductase)/FAD synthetase
VLGISGGRDSAALAVFVRQHRPDLDVDYFFTDTGKELPEVYEFLGRLEGFLANRSPGSTRDAALTSGCANTTTFLPSPQTRWCTRKLKPRAVRACG